MAKKIQTDVFSVRYSKKRAEFLEKHPNPWTLHNKLRAQAERAFKNYMKITAKADEVFNKQYELQKKRIEALEELEKSVVSDADHFDTIDLRLE